MHCTYCGASYEPKGLTACPSCGEPIPPSLQMPTKVPTHLAGAIFTTLACCTPAGIVAIVYAAQVNPRLLAGDGAGALAASRKARLWSWIAAGTGIGFAVLALALGWLAD